mgnify:CR=1 FL=1
MTYTYIPTWKDIATEVERYRAGDSLVSVWQVDGHEVRVHRDQIVDVRCPTADADMLALLQICIKQVTKTKVEVSNATFRPNRKPVIPKRLPTILDR